MTHFSKRIQKGILAATTAEGERAEIRAILDQLDLAVQSATFGNARLYVGEFHNAEDEKAMRIADLEERLVIRSTGDERQGRIIAGWDTSVDGGYPVSLVHNFMSLPCENGDQLIEELGQLMETARVGRAIQQFAT
ncbi:hypothetical protein [Roseateles sp. MS654]|uniref:hypothetical protein n=1 Tax=Roseateles sp. MS654 TaxID=3412685 RepID=UPI003C2D6157